jgi:hypothetical protein
MPALEYLQHQSAAPVSTDGDESDSDDSGVVEEFKEKLHVDTRTLAAGQWRTWRLTHGRELRVRHLQLHRCGATLCLRTLRSNCLEPTGALYSICAPSEKCFEAVKMHSRIFLALLVLRLLIRVGELAVHSADLLGEQDDRVLVDPSVVHDGNAVKVLRQLAQPEHVDSDVAQGARRVPLYAPSPFWKCDARIVSTMSLLMMCSVTSL